jgi:hypothetical protein
VLHFLQFILKYSEVGAKSDLPTVRKWDRLRDATATEGE